MKKYHILILIIVAIVIIFSSDLGMKIEALSPIVQTLVMLAFIIPTCVLLYLISKDVKIRKGFRIAAKIGIAFLLFCYICGAVVELIQ